MKKKEANKVARKRLKIKLKPKKEPISPFFRRILTWNNII